MLNSENPSKDQKISKPIVLSFDSSPQKTNYLPNPLVSKKLQNQKKYQRHVIK